MFRLDDLVPMTPALADTTGMDHSADPARN
jgi:hypothetical protein